MNAIFWLLMAIVALSPLPFAAVPMWSWSLLGVLVAALLVAWAVTLWRSRAEPPVSPGRLWPPAALYAAVLLWACVQLSAATPVAWHDPLWAAAGQALEAPVVGAISINPFEGGSTLLRLLAYAGVFWLALQLCRDRGRARLALRVFAAAGGLYAAYGIGVQISGTNTILWFDKTSYFGVLTSSFVNRNSYATFAGLGLVAATAALVDLFESHIPMDTGLRHKLVEGATAMFAQGWYLVSSWFLLIVALFMTESRGGFIAALAGLLVLAMALGLRRTARRSLSLGFAVAIFVAGAGFVALSGGAVLDRLSGTLERGDIREVIYERTLEAIADHPWVGTGLGSFPDAFRLYRSEALGQTVAKAHNTYLENALELGIPAAVLLVLAVGWLAALCLAGTLQRRRDAVYPCAGLAATALVATHSLFDFSLQIPAVSVAFALLLAIGCAQAWSTREV